MVVFGSQGFRGGLVVWVLEVRGLLEIYGFLGLLLILWKFRVSGVDYL